MASLTETAFFTRKFINIGLVLIVLGIIFRVVLMSATDLWQRLFPPPPPPANEAFGRLPYPSAQNSIATPSGQIVYSLETIDGGLPVLPSTMKVFFMPRSAASFGAYERMKERAFRLGFTGAMNRVGTTVWRVGDTENSLRSLDIDEISGNFHLVYNYLADITLFNDKNFSSADKTVSDARGFFSNLNLLGEGFAGGESIVSFYRFDAGALVLTTSLANADAVGVTISRNLIEKMPVVSPDFRQGLSSVLISGSDNAKKRILEARYLAGNIDLENFATYAPMTADQAFEKLKNNQTIFASLPSPMSQTITLRSVYPAYLDPYPAQSFLQPVLVFSDEKGFVAYVPLVSKE